MNDLRRELAPVPGAAWEEIESEARRTLETCLAARKLVSFHGPLGWEASAIPLGRVAPVDGSPAAGVDAGVRQVQPFAELRVPFELELAELDAVTRGAADADLDALVEAAGAIAAAEDHAVFHGLEAAGMRGLVSHSSHKPMPLGDDCASYPEMISRATEELREHGVGGPYALALGPRCFTGLSRTTGPGGYPVLRHVQRLLDGPVVWAPVLDGAVVMSLRGGDFELHVGRDVAIGYQDHDARSVRLYLVESLAFRLLTPEAAVPLAWKT